MKITLFLPHSFYLSSLYQTNSNDSQQETPAVISGDGESNGSEVPGDSQTDMHTAEDGSDESHEETPKISQGYVMVPILTPYYDPSGTWRRSEERGEVRGDTVESSEAEKGREWMKRVKTEEKGYVH